MTATSMRALNSRPSYPRFPLGNVGLVLFAVFLVLLALTGGYSRYDTGLLIGLRPLLAIIAAGFLLLPGGEMQKPARHPALLLMILTLIVALQLVPLPPAVWTALSERAGYVQAAKWIGGSQPWRPLTVVPVLTWNSLFALLPAAVMVLAVSRLNHSDIRFCVVILLLLGVASAFLGVVQISTGGGYFYRNASVGLPTGIFSNRNHQAAFLASLLPLLAIWAAYFNRGLTSMSRWIAASSVAVLFVITVLITGSRTGLLLAGLNLLGAGWLVWRAPSSQSGSKVSRNALSLLILLVGALAGLVAAAVYFGRGGGISRLAELDTGAEMRVRAWPVLRELIVVYLPWGSGFGTFDPLFRIYEPDALLKPSFFNNAHNDLIELAITGGAPALLLVLALILWIAWRIMATVRLWRRFGLSSSISLPFAGAMMVMTWLLASLSDYPLRTPFAGALFAFACCLLASDGAPSTTRRL